MKKRITMKKSLHDEKLDFCSSFLKIVSRKIACLVAWVRLFCKNINKKSTEKKKRKRNKSEKTRNRSIWCANFSIIN